MKLNRTNSRQYILYSLQQRKFDFQIYEIVFSVYVCCTKTSEIINTFFMQMFCQSD